MLTTQVNYVIALIGYEDTHEDRAVLRVVVDDLCISDESMWFIQVYTLADGKDFLKSHTHADVVIMMRILDAKSEPSDQISTLQTPENWRDRLNTCGAAVVYVWGDERDDCSISDEYLGHIRGFELSRLRTWRPIARYRHESRRVN